MNPNNELFAYMQLVLRNQRSGNGNVSPKFLRLFLDYARAILTILKLVLKDAAIELLFVVLFGIVILKMSQGRDLIVSMFEPGGLYGSGRVLLTLLAVIAFSVSMWLIPAFLFEYRNDLYSNTKDSFKDHLFFAHRILPMIPFWVMAYALFNHSAWLFILIAIGELGLLSTLNWYFKAGKTRRYFSLCLLVLFLAFGGYFMYNYRVEYLSVKRALATILYLLSALIFMFYYEMDRRILNEHHTGDKNISNFKRYPYNTFFFFFYLVVHIILVSLIIVQKVHLAIAPESMLLYVFAVYVFVIDLIVYVCRVHPAVQTVSTLIAVTISALLLLGAIHFNSTQYTLDRIPISPKFANYSMKNIDDYFAKWKERISQNKTGHPYPIILVAGEGGGSRAGYWFSRNLIDLDSQTNGKLRDHIFSLSTVSGSSVGLGTYFEYLEQPVLVKNGVKQIPAGYSELPEYIYRTNFVGSSVSGLFITDLFHSLVRGNWKEDRNNILIREESLSTAEAVKKLQRNDQDYTSGSILDAEFMSLFYDSTGNYTSLRTDRPLVFINTCRSNDGRRGILSPVRLKPSQFSDVVDINGYLYQDSVWCNNFSKKRTAPDSGISFGQACVTSELFPLFSAPLYIDKLGSFVDGGYHENSGLKTTLEIYSVLKKLLENEAELTDKYMIYIVFLKTGSAAEDIYKEEGPSLPISQPLSALAGQPFNGSASYFEEKARYIDSTSPKTKFLRIALDYKVLKDSTGFAISEHDKRIQKEISGDLMQKGDTILNFPLARWLSNSVIDRMDKYQSYVRTHKNPVMSELLNGINAIP